MCASKFLTAAVHATRCFTNAWEQSPTPMGSVCAVHTNACAIALKRNHTKSCLIPTSPINLRSPRPKRPQWAHLKLADKMSIVLLTVSKLFVDNSKAFGNKFILFLPPLTAKVM